MYIVQYSVTAIPSDEQLTASYRLDSSIVEMLAAITWAEYHSRVFYVLIVFPN